MKTLTAILAAAVAGCADQQPVRQPVVNPPVEATPVSRRNPYDPPPLSADQRAVAKKKAKIYYDSLARSIIELDDLTSPPDTIARVAARRNAKLLQDYKRADMANFYGISTWADTEVEAKIIELPTQPHIDDATTMVLKIRKARSGN